MNRTIFKSRRGFGPVGGWGLALILFSAMTAMTTTTCCSDEESGQETDDSDNPENLPAVTRCQPACEAFQTACGFDDDCESICANMADSYNYTDCQPELDAYYACVAALDEALITCGDIQKYFGVWNFEGCEDKSGAASFCQQTDGEPCISRPEYNDSCTMANQPDNFVVCRVNATIPDGCETSGGSDGWYCCPEPY